MELGERTQPLIRVLNKLCRDADVQDVAKYAILLAVVLVIVIGRGEPTVGKAKPSTRAEWHSSTSAGSGVLNLVLDTADIVRDACLRQLQLV